ncbi:helix-turn-helix domain-containing protein [Nocardia sp. CDC159]|uniref:Helix-turn-helix domain-containing protein n=1 Tax=Nocardia pulmonis TaxID=2951408 RepID=A0A9X2ITU5_9NOCA|nr:MULTISPECIES: helix-turn-helix domain-containing protein [Nocardia]MCM6772147.1 helix-turn-helix domain-containing protein [Nocardia pulmonis]MCM6785195.1 helix-turn-helix domain-containing protein [Nocardia sp. CDC159]
MDVDELNVDLIYRALANPARCRIMEWLKQPGAHFDDARYREHGLDIADGVCVQDIQRKLGLAQSVVSTYLQSMQRAGLLSSYRYSKWTYYRRDEETVRAFAEYVATRL